MQLEPNLINPFTRSFHAIRVLHGSRYPVSYVGRSLDAISRRCQNSQSLLLGFRTSYQANVNYTALRRLFRPSTCQYSAQELTRSEVESRSLCGPGPQRMFRLTFNGLLIANTFDDLHRFEIRVKYNRYNS